MNGGYLPLGGWAPRDPVFECRGWFLSHSFFFPMVSFIKFPGSGFTWTSIPGRGYVVTSRYSSKFPNWGCGTPSKWPFMAYKWSLLTHLRYLEWSSQVVFLYWYSFCSEMWFFLPLKGQAHHMEVSQAGIQKTLILTPHVWVISFKTWEILKVNSKSLTWGDRSEVFIWDSETHQLHADSLFICSLVRFFCDLLLIVPCSKIIQKYLGFG